MRQKNFKKPKGRACVLFDTSEPSQGVKSNHISALQLDVTPLVQSWGKSGEMGQNPIRARVWCQDISRKN